MTALLFLLTQYMYKYIGCLNIHGTNETALLFLLTQYMYKYIGCLNIHGTQVTTNNSINDNVIFCFVSDLKLVYYSNYYSLITMPWTREEKIFWVTTYLETKSFKTLSK